MKPNVARALVNSRGNTGDIQKLLDRHAKSLDHKTHIFRKPLPGPTELLDRVAERLAWKLRPKSGSAIMDGAPVSPAPVPKKKILTPQIINKRAELVVQRFVDKLRKTAGLTTVYYASPNRQLVRIPKGTSVSTVPDTAFQMGRFYPKTKQTWTESDISGKWTGKGQPSWAPGKMPSGTPEMYTAEVSEVDLEPASATNRYVRKLRRSIDVQKYEPEEK